MRPRWMASIICRGRLSPKCAGTSPASSVFSPRPSLARTAYQSAIRPMSIPPPQSPEMSPIAGNRNVRPSGATAEQLVP